MTVNGTTPASPTAEIPSEVDVLVVGGGPAGLSCALLLGRCRRRVIVFDDDRARNARAHGVHGFLTREGTPPGELRRIAREQIAPFGVLFRPESVTDARRMEVGGTCGFELVLSTGQVVRGKKLVLATGMKDDLPLIEGLSDMLGTSVHTCPYCDGWEENDRRIAAYAPVADAADFALGLTTWSDDIVLFTDAGPRLPDADLARLAKHRITVRTERIVRLEGDDGHLRDVVLATGEAVPRDTMFVHMGRHQRSPLPERLGATFNAGRTVDVDALEHAGVPGLWVIGDASRDVQFAIVAAAEGAKAGYAINRELREEVCRAREAACDAQAEPVDGARPGDAP